MSGKQTPGKNQDQANQARRPGEDAGPQSEWASPASAYNAWRRSADLPGSLDPSQLITLQRTVGNQVVRRMLIQREEDGCCDDDLGLQRAPEQLLQRHDEENNLPAPSTPSGLATSPGSQVSAIPQTVQQAHQRQVDAGNPRGALDAVVQHMASEGQIDMALLRTEANSNSRQSICTGADCFIFENVQGAFTHYCDPIASGERRLPNPRIKINPTIISRLPGLHSTLLHEYRHILQHYALLNAAAGTPGTGGPHDCLYCNEPAETDAYLVEVEQGYDRFTMLRAYVRVHVNFEYMPPEQRAVFQARKDAAWARIQQHFPNIDLSTNQWAADYRNRCEQLIAVHEARTGLTRPFYCNSAMAPLNANRQSGQQPAAGGGGAPGSGGAAAPGERPATASPAPPAPNT